MLYTEGFQFSNFKLYVNTTVLDFLRFHYYLNVIAYIGAFFRFS